MCVDFVLVGVNAMLITFIERKALAMGLFHGCYDVIQLCAKGVRKVCERSTFRAKGVRKVRERCAKGSAKAPFAAPFSKKRNHAHEHPVSDQTLKI